MQQSSVPRITRCDLPAGALLGAYAANGSYTDCFATDVTASVSLASLVEAFYTSFPFKLERLVLAVLVAKPSSDAGARRLARGEAETFAAWSVEARAADQLMVCDFLNRTRSWLMVQPSAGGGTRLYFGTGIAPVGIAPGKSRLGFPFNALLPFHQLYARILLGAARGRVLKLSAQTKTAEPELRR